MTKKKIGPTTCDKYVELINTLKVGEIYRYIGDGEFEIVDLKKIIDDILDKTTYGIKLP